MFKARYSRIRKSLVFGLCLQLFSILLSISVLLFGLPSITMAAEEMLQIGKIVLEPTNLGEPSGFLAPGKTRVLRIRAYDKNGKLLSDKVLQEAVRQGKLKAVVINPVGSTVITHDAIRPPINWMPDGTLGVTITAGPDDGAANVEIMHEDFPEAVGRRLVSVGDTSMIEPSGKSAFTKGFFKNPWVWGGAALVAGAAAAGGGGGSSSSSSSSSGDSGGSSGGSGDSGGSGGDSGGSGGGSGDSGGGSGGGQGGFQFEGSINNGNITGTCTEEGETVSLSGTFSIQIEANGTLTGNGNVSDEFFSLTGMVSNDGSLSGTTGGNDSFQGTITRNGDTLSLINGSWSGTDEAEVCNGTWSGEGPAA